MHLKDITIDFGKKQEKTIPWDTLRRSKSAKLEKVFRFKENVLFYLSNVFLVLVICYIITVYIEKRSELGSSPPENP